jgi:hypothetical protein
MGLAEDSVVSSVKHLETAQLGKKCELTGAHVACFLSTFKPLCLTAAGRRAVKSFGHPPFADASCRREPDFESRFPSISTVCHDDKFAPRLHKGDRVAYLTIKHRYAGHDTPHWRFVAALEVIERFEKHSHAAAWYQSHSLVLPSNCMVSGNPPLEVEHTAWPKKNLRQWDLGYMKRTRRNGVFLVCKALFLELREPSIVVAGDLIRVFGRVPGTQNPPCITEFEFDNLLALSAR